ncbi:MAG: C39 family peptidase [bacterium]|nr:C39 family peptidase [bacterium]
MNIKKIILTLAISLAAFSPLMAGGAHYAGGAIGYILLQVEASGEAWYVYPANGKSYYLGRPADAFNIMKTLALGVKHDFIVNTSVFSDRLAGLILLDTEASGEAYYIYPKNLKKYYLGRPADAFKIMRELGLGITNANLANLPIGVIGEPVADFDFHKKVLIDNVPFTSQAPFGGWNDQRQQDGCEESSALMAVKWARGQNLTKAEALKEITGLSDWLLKKYGEYRDISAENTVDWIFKDYFKYNKITLVHDITANDIIAELAKGNLIITPMNGQIMHNPNYKAPGPPRHMIVIRGYDPGTKQFITNDPGTRNGELYLYDDAVLFEAIRDYPTGYHEIINQIEKNMIVISK